MNRLNMRVVAGISVAGALSLPACQSGEAYYPVPEISTEIIEPQQPSLLEGYEAANNPCIDVMNSLHLGFMDKNETLIKARECNARRIGTIALVYYDGLPAETMGALASDIDFYMPAISKGVLNPTTSIVEASQEAQELFDSQNEAGCVDHRNDEVAPSLIADITMSAELKHYDTVMAATTMPSCGANDNPEARGVARGTLGGRLIDLFEVDTELPAPPEDIEIYPGLFAVGTKYYDVGIAAHELLHIEGLGHANLSSQEATNSPGSVDEIAIPDDSRNIDLVEYFANANFSEYGDKTNIQGWGILDPLEDRGKELNTPDRLLNPIQMSWLNTPSDILDGSQEPAAQTLDVGESIILTQDDTFEGKFIEVDTGLRVIPSSNEGSFEVSSVDAQRTAHVASTLAIVPKVKYVDGVYAIELFLVSPTDRTTTSMGTFINRQGKSEFTITLPASKTVAIEIKEGALHAKVSVDE